jgi:LAGLIDADG DNA endonuclease family
MRSRVIEEHKKSLKLSDEQREALVGILLGDACLESRNGGRIHRVKVEQSAKHETYVRHLHALFGPWVLSPPHEKECKASNGTITTSWTFNTVSHPAFRFYAHQFYADGKKKVPRLIHRWLTPRGLAYWFMDDGSMKSSQSKGVIFNTHCFTKQEVDRLTAVLQKNFGLQARLRKQSDGWQIYVSGASFEAFLQLVQPFVIAEMQYKLPPTRRTRLPKK